MNPYYGNQFYQTMPQSYNPYQNFQPQQTSFQPVGISGKFVSDFQNINANDVPMDGNPAIFPKNDLSEIQVRSWGANGQITTTSYKPILDDVKPKVNNLPFNEEKLKNDLLDELTGLFDDRFSKLETLIKPQRAKKESGAGE